MHITIAVNIALYMKRRMRVDNTDGVAARDQLLGGLYYAQLEHVCGQVHHLTG
jgi:hypothetical protein